MLHKYVYHLHIIFTGIYILIWTQKKMYLEDPRSLIICIFIQTKEKNENCSTLNTMELIYFKGKNKLF